MNHERSRAPFMIHDLTPTPPPIVAQAKEKGPSCLGPFAKRLGAARRALSYKPNLAPKRMMRGLRFDPSTPKVVAVTLRSRVISVLLFRTLNRSAMNCKLRDRRSADSSPSEGRGSTGCRTGSIELARHQDALRAVAAEGGVAVDTGYGVPCLPNRLPATSMSHAI